MSDTYYVQVTVVTVYRIFCTINNNMSIIIIFFLYSSLFVSVFWKNKTKKTINKLINKTSNSSCATELVTEDE